VDFVKARKPKMIVLDTSRTSEDHARFVCLAKAVLSGIHNRVFSQGPGSGAETASTPRSARRGRETSSLKTNKGKQSCCFPVL